MFWYCYYYYSHLLRFMAIIYQAFFSILSLTLDFDVVDAVRTCMFLKICYILFFAGHSLRLLFAFTFKKKNRSTTSIIILFDKCSIFPTTFVRRFVSFICGLVLYFVSNCIPIKTVSRRLSSIILHTSPLVVDLILHRSVSLLCVCTYIMFFFSTDARYELYSVNISHFSTGTQIHVYKE